MGTQRETGPPASNPTAITCELSCNRERAVNFSSETETPTDLPPSVEVGRKKENACEAPAGARASSFARAQRARGRCLPTRWLRPADAHPLPCTEAGAPARTPALPRCDRGGEGGVRGEALPRSYRGLTWQPQQDRGHRAPAARRGKGRGLTWAGN